MDTKWHRVKFVDDELPPHIGEVPELLEHWSTHLRGREVEVIFYGKRENLSELELLEGCDCEEYFKVKSAFSVSVGMPSNYTLVCRRYLDMD